MNTKIDISYYMKGVIFRTQRLLEEIKNDSKDVERFIKDFETIQSDYDEQITKWFQGSDKEIIFRIYSYINQAFNYIILNKIQRPGVSKYLTTELTISPVLIDAIEKKIRLTCDARERKELYQVLTDLQNLYYASYTQSDSYCKRKVVNFVTLDELREINLLSGVERIDNYKVVQVYFRSSFSSEVTNLYEKFEKDLCVAIEDWFGAIETGYYYVLIK